MKKPWPERFRHVSPVIADEQVIRPIRIFVPYASTRAFASICGSSGPGSPAQRTGLARPVSVRPIRLSFGSPASQWMRGGGGFSPLLIPHSIDARPCWSMPYPQTMFRDGVLNEPYFGGEAQRRATAQDDERSAEEKRSTDHDLMLGPRR